MESDSAGHAALLRRAVAGIYASQKRVTTTTTARDVVGGKSRAEREVVIQRFSVATGQRPETSGGVTEIWATRGNGDRENAMGACVLFSVLYSRLVEQTQSSPCHIACVYTCMRCMHVNGCIWCIFFFL